MRPLSKQIEKLENDLTPKLTKTVRRLKAELLAKWPLLLLLWYLCGMLINAVKRLLSTQFQQGSQQAVESLLELNPILNLAAVFTPIGLGVLFCCAVMAFLYSKQGYRWFSGFKGQRDSRGFDILPDGTHGTGGWMERRQLEAIFQVGKPRELTGTILGRLTGEDEYISPRTDNGLNSHALIYGASGTGKSRGVIKPFILQAISRRESAVLLDPKGELYESTSEYARKKGMVVKVYNLLDMPNSDGFNCISDIESDRTLVQSVAEVIIRNTSNESERQDFWSKAELNLLMAMLHYVVDMRDDAGRLLPIERRSLGEIYRLLSTRSITELEVMFDKLKRAYPHHPALAPYGLFKQANRQIWGNIAIGLGNRLSVFQNRLVDTITRYNDIDLTLPGQVPCVYYCVISAQDSSLEFLSSMFFSLMFARLAAHARRYGERGRLPVTVNMVLDEYCNCGSILDFKKILSVCRSQGVNCQIAVQGLAQLADRHPHNEWEEIVGNCDYQIFLGCNDNMTAEYVSKKCSTVTIRTTTASVPMRPLFSPIFGSVRQASEGRQNTKRELMMPDELLALDNRKCIILARGQRPLMLYKITPEELPAFRELVPVSITDYKPAWRELEDMEEQPAQAPEPPSRENATPNVTACGAKPADEEAAPRSEPPIRQYELRETPDQSSKADAPASPDLSELENEILARFDYDSGYTVVKPGTIHKRKDNQI